MHMGQGQCRTKLDQVAAERFLCFRSSNHAAAAAAAKSLQSCPTLCDPIDSSPPGSPIPGILQARIPEWKRERKVRLSEKFQGSLGL